MPKFNFSKPKYIRKYDFMRSFYRPKSHWFWPTTEVDKHLSDLVKEFYKLNSRNENFISYAMQDDEESSTSDYDIEEDFDNYKEKKIKVFEKNEDLNETDPKVMEGKIIDQKAKKFIKEQYKNLPVIDFDDEKYKNKTSEQLSDITLKIIIENKDVILFQPTFIARNIAIDKPDAFIIHEGQYILIETKATTKAKAVHFLDLFYQDNIINDVLKANNLKEINEYYICLVAITKNKKNELFFLLNENITYQKEGVSFNKKKEEKKIFFKKYSDDFLIEKQKAILCIEAEYDLSYNNHKKFLKIFSHNNQNFENVFEKTYATNNNHLKEFAKKITTINFWKTVEEIYSHEIDNLDFSPVKEFTSPFKNNDSFKLIKEYYRCSNLYPYVGYSGYLQNYNDQISNKTLFCKNQKANFISDIAVIKNFPNTKKNNSFNNYFNATLQPNNGEYYLSNNACEDFKKKKKSKKVYFDFETISLAVRIIDDTVPFLQVVNQVSIITDNNEIAIKKLKSNNILFDPKTISIKDFKYIIDQLLKDVTNPDEYNFVVYNQSFEKSRLEEMALLINEEEYYAKARSIIDNLWDLANYFDVRKPECIYVWELKGFYSIKYVLNMIMNKRYDLFEKTGCKNYKKLDIQNGTQAQSKSAQRFFDIICDEEWNENIVALKEYCENDVRAMIAVEYWINDIIIHKEKNNA